MDIFTTVLTRVVPVPIKPASLKVKALLKEAGTGKLKEDVNHLENHDFYVNDNKGEHAQHEHEHEADAEQQVTADISASAPTENNQDEQKSTAGIKHLDLYV